MDSCFPPLAALSLRDTRKNNPAATGNTTTTTTNGAMQNRQSATPDIGKIEILQDLDLYYIRQIAHNLKVISFENIYENIFHLIRIYP